MERTINYMGLNKPIRIFTIFIFYLKFYWFFCFSRRNLFLFSLKLYWPSVKYIFVNKNETFIFFSLLDASRIPKLLEEYPYFHIVKKKNTLDNMKMIVQNGIHYARPSHQTGAQYLTWLQFRPDPPLECGLYPSIRSFLANSSKVMCHMDPPPFPKRWWGRLHCNTSCSSPQGRATLPKTNLSFLLLITFLLHPPSNKNLPFCTAAQEHLSTCLDGILPGSWMA